MIGEKFVIEVPYGLGTQKIQATVIEHLGNDEYVLEGENGNRYTRKLVWQKSASALNNIKSDFLKLTFPQKSLGGFPGYYEIRMRKTQFH